MKRVLAAATIFALLTVAPAYAATGTISGIVTDAAGLPLPSVCVSARTYVTSSVLLSPSSGTTTGSDGTYLLSVLPGAHVIQFLDCDDDGVDHIEEYYDDAPDQSSATPVFVGAGENIEGVDAALDVGASIAGTVTDANARPLESVCVDGIGDTLGSSARTDLDGSFVLRGLRAGSYRVAFGGGCAGSYANEYYDDVETYEDAAVLTVVPGQAIVGIDAELAAYGGPPRATIAGTVTSEEGEPLEGMCVEAWLVDGGGFEYTVAQEQTYPGGGYRIEVAPGDHKLAFHDCSDGLYRAEWFDDKVYSWEADVIAVASETTTVVDAALARKPDIDFGVEIVDIENVEVRTDGGPTPVQPGVRRRIRVQVGNHSIIRGGARVDVEVCPRGVGSCSYIWGDAVTLGADERRRLEVDWDGMGYAGDVTVRAFVSSDGDSVDPNSDNDVSDAEHYVVIGGTGFGVGGSIP